MVLTLKSYAPAIEIDDTPPGDIPHPATKSLINFACRILTRYGEVLVDFAELTDVLNYSDNLSVEGASGSWTLRMKANQCNERLLKSIHPGLCVEFYCSRNSSPIKNVLRDPSTVKRLDSSPELPVVAAVNPAASTLPQAAVTSSGGSTPVNASGGSGFTSGFMGIRNDRDKYLLAVTAITEGLSGNVQSQVDTAVAMGNRLQSGKWGNSISSVILAPGQFEAVTRWNLAGVSDENSAVTALARAKGYSTAQARTELNRFMGGLSDPNTVSSSINHVRGATDYRGPAPNTVKMAGDYQRNNSDNFYIPPGGNGASISVAEGQKLKQKGLQAIGGGVATLSPVSAAPATTATPQQIVQPPEILGGMVKGIEDPYGLDQSPHLLFHTKTLSLGGSSDLTDEEWEMWAESFKSFAEALPGAARQLIDTLRKNRGFQ